MSFSINKAYLLGNVTKDPELRYTPSGQPVLTFNMATNRSIKKNDQWEDVPTFHRIVVWGKIAEWLSNHLFKGYKVAVEGRIESREYTKKDGTKDRMREIIAENCIPMTEGKGQPAAKPTEEVEEIVIPDDFPEGGEQAPTGNVNPPKEDEMPF